VYSQNQGQKVSNIIVIGASAGGFEALRTIVRALPGELAAATFIVMHFSADTPSLRSEPYAERTV